MSAVRGGAGRGVTGDAPHRTFRSIQALRGIAATVVLLYHLAGIERDHGRAGFRVLRPFMYFGAEGVDLFFVISGFIIVWTNYDGFGVTRRIPKYLARRAARILPLYWIFFGFAVGFALLGYSHALDAASGRWNLVEVFLLLPIECRHIVPVSWTLTFELLFYYVFAVALLFRRHYFMKFLAVWLMVVMLNTFVLPRYVDATSLPGRIDGVVMHFRTIEFMLGCSVAWLLKRRALPCARGWSIAGTALFAAGAVRLWWVDPGSQSSVWRTDLIAIFGLGASGIVAGCVAQELAPAGLTVPRWLVSLGDMSYSLYLSHLFAFAVFRRFLEPINGTSVALHLAWLLSLGSAGLVAGLVTYRFLERPLLKFLAKTIDPPSHGKA